jgi:hypothetical protein
MSRKIAQAAGPATQFATSTTFRPSHGDVMRISLARLDATVS